MRDDMTRLLSLILTLLLAPWADASLRAHVNVDFRNIEHAVVEPERLAYDGLVTDMHVKVAGVQDPKAAHAQAIAKLRVANPTATIGSYLSSRMVRERDDIRCYPVECLDPRYFAESELMTPEWDPPFEPGRFVDYRQPVARAKLIRLITNEAVARGLPIIFTDNWVSDQSYAGFIPWRETVEFMGELRAALKLRGVKLFANIAIAIGAIPDADVAKLATSTDGVSLEMAMVPYVGSNPAVLAKALSQYRALLDKKVTVVFLVVVPGGTKEQVAAESRFLAGLALALDGPLVAAPIFEQNPEWHLWPDLLGKPRAPSAGGALKQEGTLLSRRFERGMVTVDTAARTVSVS